MPRLSISVSDSQLAEIVRHQEREGLRSLGAAALDLLMVGLKTERVRAAAVDSADGIQFFKHVLSPEMMQLAAAADALKEGTPTGSPLVTPGTADKNVRPTPANAHPKSSPQRPSKRVSHA